MNRFFVDGIPTDRFPLPVAIVHQVLRVLRLHDGDEITLVDNAGSQARCRLDDGDCVVVERGAAGGEPAHRLTVCQALIKGDRLDEVIRHGTEIGVAAFRLIVSERCIVREVSPRRLERLRAIAREAAEQSERGLIPPVHDPVPLAEVLEASSVLLYERHDRDRLSRMESPGSVIIGPEGGFTPAEVEAAAVAGVRLAGLGQRILRSESVALAAAAVILSRTGDFA